MNGGAVKDDRSPLKLAIDLIYFSILEEMGKRKQTFRNEVQEPRACGGTAAPSSFEDDAISGGFERERFIKNEVVIWILDKEKDEVLFD
jgi:hypothetical protein